MTFEEAAEILMAPHIDDVISKKKCYQKQTWRNYFLSPNIMCTHIFRNGCKIYKLEKDPSHGKIMDYKIVYKDRVFTCYWWQIGETAKGMETDPDNTIIDHAEKLPGFISEDPLTARFQRL